MDRPVGHPPDVQDGRPRLTGVYDSAAAVGRGAHKALQIVSVAVCGGAVSNATLVHSGAGGISMMPSHEAFQHRSTKLRIRIVVSLGPYGSYGKLHLPRVTTELELV